MRKVLCIGLMAMGLALGMTATAGAAPDSTGRHSVAAAQFATASSSDEHRQSLASNASDVTPAACTSLPDLETQGGHSTVVRCTSGYHGNVYDDEADGNCIFMKGQWFNSAGARIKVQYSTKACPKGDVDYWQFNHPSGWDSFLLTIHHE